MKLSVVLETAGGDEFAQIKSGQELTLENRMNWRSSVSGLERFEGTQGARDSCDLMDDASLKLETYKSRGWFCEDETALLAAVRAEPKCERLALLCLASAWYDEPLLGFVLLRRTWKNNLFVDFLSGHPKNKIHRVVRGIGTVLLYGAAEFANAISAENMIIETTDQSIGFYHGILELEDEQNIVQISSKKALQLLVATLNDKGV